MATLLELMARSRQALPVPVTQSAPARTTPAQQVSLSFQPTHGTTLLELMAKASSGPATRRQLAKPVARQAVSVAWQDAIRAIPPRLSPLEVGPQVLPGGTRPTKITVFVQGNKKQVVVAHASGVPGLVVHRKVGGVSGANLATITHGPSGFFVADVGDATLADAAAIARALAGRHPSIDWSLSVDALRPLLAKTWSKGIQDVQAEAMEIASDAVAFPGLARRRAARQAHHVEDMRHARGQYITGDMIVQALDTGGEIRGSGWGSNFVDVLGFRFHFGWEGDTLVPVTTYAHQVQGERHPGGKVLDTPEIRAALRRFLARLAIQRHLRAEREGLPLLHRLPLVRDEAVVLDPGQARLAEGVRVDSNGARTEMSVARVFVLDGRTWVTSGFSYHGGRVSMDLDEVVPVTAWRGPVYAMSLVERARKAGLANSWNWPAGMEIKVKGQRWVYTGRARSASGPSRPPGSASRRA